MCRKFKILDAFQALYYPEMNQDYKHTQKSLNSTKKKHWCKFCSAQMLKRQFPLIYSWYSAIVRVRVVLN